jgi:hypothetical protein
VPSIAGQTAGWKPAAPRLPAGGGGGGRAGGRGRTAPAPRAPKAEKPFATSDRFSAAEALEMEAEILNEAQQAWARYGVQVEKAAEPVDSFVLQLSESQEALLEMGSIGSRALEDLAIGGDNLGDTFKRLLQDIARLIFQLGVAQPMMNAIRQGFSGGVTPPNPDAQFSWGNLFSTAASAFFGGARAGGGDVLPDREYWVGENGPERFRPRTAGAILPAGAGASSGAPLIINQTTGRVDNVQKQRMPDGREAWLLQELSNPNSQVGRILQQRWGVRPVR